MTQELKTKWIAALRSGEYRQGQLRLVRQDSEGGLSHCCLGVLCEVAGFARLDDLEDRGFLNYKMPTGEAVGAYLPHSIVSRDIQKTLSKMNDRESKDFAEIADWIEENV